MDLYYDTKLNIARQLSSSSRVPRIIGLVSWYESTSSKSFNDYEIKEGEMIYK